MLCLPVESYTRRRQALFERLPIGAALLLPTATEKLRSGDSHYPFRPDSDFYYITGFSEPHAVALLKKGEDTQSFTLFVLAKDPEKEVWTGIRQGVEGAVDNFGADGDLEARINSFELAYRMQTDAREAFDIAGEKPATVAKYGNSAQGRQMMIARRLLERGVRFVQVTQDGWDLHNGIARRAKRNADQLDPAIGALMDDLKDRGMFKDTLIYITSEFGRTPREDGRGGRGHNKNAMSTVLAGGGIKGGMAYGSTDEIGGAAEENPVHVKDIHATVLNRLGFDHEQLTFRTGGRDFRLTQPTRSLPQGGMPVQGILA